MPLIDNLKRAAAGPSPAEQRKIIEAKLKAAEVSLAELAAKRDAASLDALIEAPGAKDALARLNAASKEARAEIETLYAAQRAAIAREQEANRSIRRDAIKHAFQRTKAHLKARTEAAQAYATAIEAATKAFQKIHECDEKAREHMGRDLLWPSKLRLRGARPPRQPHGHGHSALRRYG
jgi:putative heme degradation protein